MGASRSSVTRCSIRDRSVMVIVQSRTARTTIANFLLTVLLFSFVSGGLGLGAWLLTMNIYRKPSPPESDDARGRKIASWVARGLWVLGIGYLIGWAFDWWGPAQS